MVSVASDCRVTIIITARQLRQLQRPNETAHTQSVNPIVLSGGASWKSCRRAFAGEIGSFVQMVDNFFVVRLDYWTSCVCRALARDHTMGRIALE